MYTTTQRTAVGNAMYSLAWVGVKLGHAFIIAHGHSTEEVGHVIELLSKAHS